MRASPDMNGRFVLWGQLWAAFPVVGARIGDMEEPFGGAAPFKFSQGDSERSFAPRIAL